ncbi:hypothetical protein TNCV_1072631 [Trichonephila clavipes]|nr:hypothetical protein TNCV_1072631 [Trichonephila clavipes]
MSSNLYTGGIFVLSSNLYTGESLSFLQKNENVTLIESSDNEEQLYKLEVKEQGMSFQIILSTPNRVFLDNRKLADESCNKSSSNN